LELGGQQQILERDVRFVGDDSGCARHARHDFAKTLQENSVWLVMYLYGDAFQKFLPAKAH